MSVDPDDVTPLGIRNSGAKVAFYGLPVLAGAMFLYAKLDDVHILGVYRPALLHAPTTAFRCTAAGGIKRRRVDVCRNAQTGTRRPVSKVRGMPVSGMPVLQVSRDTIFAFLEIYQRFRSYIYA